MGKAGKVTLRLPRQVLSTGSLCDPFSGGLVDITGKRSEDWIVEVSTVLRVIEVTQKEVPQIRVPFVFGTIKVRIVRIDNPLNQRFGLLRTSPVFRRCGMDRGLEPLVERGVHLRSWGWST